MAINFPDSPSVNDTHTVGGSTWTWDGTKWTINAVDIPVDSVNSQTGAVVLDADDIDDTSTTHKFATAAELSKLAGIEAGATADQTDAEIKTAYENNANTNAFTDAEQTKLSGIAAGAEVNVNADWNAVSGDAQILNKPTIPPAAPVDSVNGQTGVVVLDSDDIAEGVTNLYGKWANATGGINYAGGNVGIGTTTPDVALDISATDAVQMPSGTTAQRPGTPVNGQTRYNSTLGAMEVYVQGQWQVIANTSIDYGLITSAVDTTFDYGALS